MLKSLKLIIEIINNFIKKIIYMHQKTLKSRKFQFIIHFNQVLLNYILIKCEIYLAYLNYKILLYFYNKFT